MIIHKITLGEDCSDVKPFHSLLGYIHFIMTTNVGHIFGISHQELAHDMVTHHEVILGVTMSCAGYPSLVKDRNIFPW